MTGSAWADISDEAKDFVKRLLNKCGHVMLCSFMQRTCNESLPRIICSLNSSGSDRAAHFLHRAVPEQQCNLNS